jgi:uncharacterized membrane protein
MEFLKGKTLLDRSFQASITLKGLDGLLEIVGGVLLLGANPARVNNWVAALMQHALSRNPHDFLAAHLLSMAHQFNAEAQYFGFLYLVSHGLAKVILVVALWLNRIWAYPAMIVLLFLFILYQLYRMTFAPSWWLIWLTVFDGIVIWLTWEEFKKQKRIKQEKSGD